MTQVREGVLTLRHNLALGSSAGGTEVLPGATLALEDITLLPEPLTLGAPDPEEEEEVPQTVFIAVTTPADDGGEVAIITPADDGGEMQILGGFVQFDVSRGSALQISRAISGPGQVQKAGAGTLILDAANTYAGLTQVLEGTLTLRNSDALGSPEVGTELLGGTAMVLENNITVLDDLSLVGDPPGTEFPGVTIFSHGNNSFGNETTPVEAPKIALNPFLTVTVVVDGLDQAVQEGPLSWSQPYNTHLVYRDETPEGKITVIARHYGYKDRLGVTHLRGVSYEPPGSWIIWDWLTGSGVHHLELNWHLGCRPTPVDGGYKLDGVGVPLSLTVEGGTCSLHEGTEEPIAGWCSRSYGQKEPISTLRVEHKGPLPHEFMTRLRVG
jgi:autotransporter-associated beta strand protein